MHHLFIGLGGTGVRVWQAMERRRQSEGIGAAPPGLARFRAAVATVTPAMPVLLIDTDASLHDDDAPGWCLAGRSLAPPRVQRLLLAAPHCAVYRAEILAALSNALRQTVEGNADGARTVQIHLIAHPGEPVGAGLLIGVLDALRDVISPVAPAAVQLHLTLSEQTPVLAALQQRAEAVPPGFDRCWLSTPIDERGVRQTDAAQRQERQAQWLLQTWAEEGPAAAEVVAAPRGEFALWGLAEWHSDLVAVQGHLGHALLSRLLAQLRFDHWRPPLGYVHHPAALRAVAGGEALPEDPLAWPGGSPGDAAGPPPPTLATAQQDWQRLAAHYLQLVQHCAPGQRRGELRRLFALGVSERFGGAGVAEAFALPAAAARQRAEGVRVQIETALWEAWRLGSVSLRDCVARVAAHAEQASVRVRDLEGRQARDDRLVASLRLQIDAEAAPSPTPMAAPGRWFGPRAGDLHPFALRLQAWAQATTAQAHTALLRRQWTALHTALSDLHDQLDAAELALASLAGEADRAAEAALAPATAGADGMSLRLDTREQVQALGKTWVLAEAAQRESVAFLRADLFTRLGDGARFRRLALHLDERAGCARLLAASTQRLAPSVIASVAQSAMLALARAWQDDPAARSAALQRLRAQAAGGAWAVALAGGGAPDIRDSLTLPTTLLPASPEPPDAEDAEEAEAVTDGLRVSLQAVPVPWPTGAVDLRLAAPGSPAASRLVWRRQIAPVPLAALRGLQPPEPAAADHAPDRRPGLLLLGEALGLVREDIGAGVVLVRLDDDGFEADRVPLGAHWDAAATGMPEPVRCWLQEDVEAALRSSPIRPDRLRDVMQRRVAQVLAAAATTAPEDAEDAEDTEGLRRRWPAALQTALQFLPA